MAGRSKTETFILVLVVAFLAAVVGSAIYGAVLWTIKLVKHIVHVSGQILTAILAAVAVISLITLFLDIVILPLIRHLQYLRACWQSVAQCFLPLYATFVGDEGGSQMDQLLGRCLLARKFFDMTGYWPDRNISMDLEQYGDLKNRELPRLVFGRYRHLFTRVFIQTHALYKSGAPISQQIDRAIEAEARVRRPLWLTRRWLCIVSFGYFGLKADDTFYLRDTAKQKENQEYVLKILRKHFFTWLPACEQHLPGLELELKELLPPAPQPTSAETKEPADEPPAPASEEEEPVPIPEEQVEEEPDPEPEVDVAALQKEAVETFNSTKARVLTDNDGWNNPAQHLQDHDAVLLSDLVQGYHPEPDVVQSEIELNRLRMIRLESFDAAFEALMNQEHSDDGPWGVPWADRAAAEMAEAGFSEIADIRWFRRLAVRQFVLSDTPDTEPQESDDPPPPPIGSPDNEPSPAPLSVPKGF